MDERDPEVVQDEPWTSPCSPPGRSKEATVWVSTNSTKHGHSVCSSNRSLSGLSYITEEHNERLKLLALEAKQQGALYDLQIRERTAALHAEERRAEREEFLLHEAKRKAEREEELHQLEHQQRLKDFEQKQLQIEHQRLALKRQQLEIDQMRKQTNE